MHWIRTVYLDTVCLSMIYSTKEGKTKYKTIMILKWNCLIGTSLNFPDPFDFLLTLVYQVWLLSENQKTCLKWTFWPLKLNRWFQMRRKRNNKKGNRDMWHWNSPQNWKSLLLFSLMKRDHLSNNGVKRKKRKAFELFWKKLDLAVYWTAENVEGYRQ